MLADELGRAILPLTTDELMLADELVLAMLADGLFG